LHKAFSLMPVSRIKFRVEPRAKPRVESRIKHRSVTASCSTRTQVRDLIEPSWRATRETHSKHSIQILKYKRPSLMSSLSLAKHTRKKTLPSRDKSRLFIKKTASSTELSDLTLEDSSPLDTPEISERTLADQDNRVRVRGHQAARRMRGR